MQGFGRLALFVINRTGWSLFFLFYVIATKHFHYVENAASIFY